MSDYAYWRTSSDGQDGAGQRHRLAEAGIAPELTVGDAGVSGMRASRPKWDALLSLVTAGDTITVTELSRIGRSVKNVLQVLEDLESRDVGVRILDLALDTRSSTGRLVLVVLVAVARLERDLISERTKSALAERKARGVPLGRKRTITDGQVRTARKLKAAGVPVGEIADTLQVPRSSLYRYLAETG